MTPNFTNAELVCKCGCGMLPKKDFIDKIQKLRELVGFTLPVSSAARCPKHNSKVSQTGLQGPHTTGRAIDLQVSHENAYNVLKTALAMGCFTGVGIQQKGQGRFIHLDDLQTNRPALWSY